MKRALLLSFALAAGCGADPAPTSRAAPTVCNGAAALCGRRYDQVTFPATHNAFTYESGGSVTYVLPNQDHPITAQLEAGIRAFGLRPSPYFGADETQAKRVYVTHNVALQGLLGQEPLADVLGEIRRFLERHPDELVTILSESAVPLSDVMATFREAGLDRYVYRPAAGASANAWPTVGELIATDRRVVVFEDRDDPSRSPAQLVMWDHIQDTDYDVTDESQFSCARYRGRPEAELYFLNQFIYRDDQGKGFVQADRGKAKIANDPARIAARVDRCLAETGKLPSFLYVDFYGEGDVVGAARAVDARR